MFAYAPIYLSNDPGFNPPTAAATLPISAPVLSSPFTGVNIEYQLTQKFQCHRAAYKPLAINSKWGTWPTATVADVAAYQGFILCAESPREDIGGNVVQWTRTYAKVPATYSLPTSLFYPFVGFQSTSGIGVTTQAGRDPFTDEAAARIQYDYFLIDPVTGNANGPIYDKATSIPLIDKQRYYVDRNTVALRYFTTVLSSVLIASNPTVPSVEDYLAWIAAKMEIVAENSKLRPWIGNIVERQTIFIFPQ